MLRRISVLVALAMVVGLAAAASAQDNILFVLGDDDAIHLIANRGISRAVTNLYSNDTMDEDARVFAIESLCAAADAGGSFPAVSRRDLPASAFYLAFVQDPDTGEIFLSLVPVQIPNGWKIGSWTGIRFR